MNGWLVVWLPGWLVCWLAGWLVGWLVGWVVGWLFGWMDGWVGGWMVDWLAGWMGGCSFFRGLTLNSVLNNLPPSPPIYSPYFHLQVFLLAEGQQIHSSSMPAPLITVAAMLH